MPGANERALEKARTLPADTLILDLEDAVAPEAKVDARQRVCAAACSDGYGRREIVIRVNGLDTEWHADRRSRGRGRRTRRHPGAQDQLGRRRSRGGGGHGVGRRPRRHRHLGHVGDTGGRPPRRGDHHLVRASHRLRDGHQRPGQGAARRAGPGPPAAAGRPVDVPAGRPPRRQGHPGRGLQRHQRRGRIRGRVRTGPPARLRRQDAHPPRPARGLQPGVRAQPRGADPGSSHHRGLRTGRG